MPLTRLILWPLAALLVGCASLPDDSVSTVRFMAAERALDAGEYRLAADEYRKAALASDDPETARAAADICFEFGRRETTLSVLDRWEALEPNAPDPWLLRGRLALRQTDADTASDSFGAFVELARAPYMDRDRAFERLGNVLLGESNQRLALDVAERLAERHSADWRAYRMVSQVALRRDDLTRSLEAAERAFELAPDSFDAAMLQAQAIVLGGDRTAGLEFAESIADNGMSTEQQLDYARFLSTSDAVDDAVRIVDDVLESQPDNADALQARAILDLRNGELDVAWERFSQLAAKPSHRHDSLFFLGNIAERRGRTEQARRIYTQIGEGPNAIIAQQRISALLFAGGDTEGAFDQLNRYSRAHPAKGFALQLTRAQLYRELGQHDAAIEIYDAMLDVRPEAEGLKLTRAEALLASGDVKGAIKQYRATLRDHPDSALSLNALGYTLADRTERYDEAYGLIVRALELEPNNAAIIDSMGWVEFKLGRYEAALEHLERAWDLIKDPEVAAHLGETLWQLGERERAREVLKEAYDRNPDSIPLRRTLERLLEQDARVES
ncbi:MAG: tetratricopeptide repeat protein [Pseudomonadota bacterium]